MAAQQQKPKPPPYFCFTVPKCDVGRFLTRGSPGASCSPSRLVSPCLRIIPLPAIQLRRRALSVTPAGSKCCRSSSPLRGFSSQTFSGWGSGIFWITQSSPTTSRGRCTCWCGRRARDAQKPPQLDWGMEAACEEASEVCGLLFLCLTYPLRTSAGDCGGPWAILYELVRAAAYVNDTILRCWAPSACAQVRMPKVRFTSSSSSC